MTEHKDLMRNMICRGAAAEMYRTGKVYIYIFIYSPKVLF